MTARQEVFRIIHDTLREKYPAPQQKVLFVGIAGTYAAGKTTFSRDILMHKHYKQICIFDFQNLIVLN